MFFFSFFLLLSPTKTPQLFSEVFGFFLGEGGGEGSFFHSFNHHQFFIQPFPTSLAKFHFDTIFVKTSFNKDECIEHFTDCLCEVQDCSSAGTVTFALRLG